MELNSGESLEMPDHGRQEWNAGRDNNGNEFTEAELQRLIEQWRNGDRGAAERVCLYVWFTYFAEVARRLAHELRNSFQDGAKAVEQNDRNESDDDVVGNTNEDLESGEIHESSEDDHDERENRKATGLNRRKPLSHQSNNQLHGPLKEGYLRTKEKLDGRLGRDIFVTKNEPTSVQKHLRQQTRRKNEHSSPASEDETYTGKYSKRTFKQQDDFKWKDEAAFRKFVTDIWVNESISWLRHDSHFQPARGAGPTLIPGDLSDPQRIQDVVHSQRRPIDKFLRKQLAVRSKGEERLSEQALLELLNSLIDGEPLWCEPELGGVDFAGLKLGTTLGTTWEKGVLLSEVVEVSGLKCGTTLNLPTGRARKRANRAVLEAAYPGLIHHTSGGRGARGGIILVTEEYLDAHAHESSEDQTATEEIADVFIRRKLLREVLELSQLLETLPEGSTSRRLVEGLLAYRKHVLWNANSARPLLHWSAGTVVTEEELNVLGSICRTPIEQLIKEVDLSIFLDDPDRNRQPLYVQATKFILRYGIPDIPRDGSEKEMSKLANTYVYQPKRRLRPKLERIVPWFYRDKDKKDEEVES